MSFAGINFENYTQLAIDHSFRGLSIGWFGQFDPETLVMTGCGSAQGIMVIFGYENGGPPFIGLDGPIAVEDHMADLETMSFVDRPHMGVVLDGDTLRGVPLGASLRIGATYYDVTEPDIQLVAPPGRVLDITIDLPPHKTFKAKYASPEN